MWRIGGRERLDERLVVYGPSPPSTEDRADPPRRWSRRTQLLTALTAVSLVAAAIGFGFFRRADRPTPIPPAPEEVRQPTIGVNGDLQNSVTQFWRSRSLRRPPPSVLTLPVPEPAPADPQQAPPAEPVGRIQIPRLGLDTTLWNGVSLPGIDRGPSHWPGTAMPGQFGNMVIAGHRVTHSRPFRHIDELQRGDRMTVTGSDGRSYVYEVSGNEITTPDRLDIVSQPVAYEATLFACHPPGSAKYRFVVYLKLLGPDGRPVTVGDYDLVHT